MSFPRSSGILLHPTSLPGRYGCGDLGSEARRFADFLQAAGQSIWQVLPVNPTGYGDSPYQSFSAFAGNPLLISLDDLRERGYLSAADLDACPAFPDGEVDFARVIPFRQGLLRQAADRFFTSAAPGDRALYDDFLRENAHWLNDFALFIAAKNAHHLVSWTEWDPALARREPEALQQWRERLAPDIAVQQYWQFEFGRQWTALQVYCHARSIRIMGDVPIYVAHDSADVWAHRDFF